MEDKKKQRFLFSKHPIFYPILAAVAAGTYPIIFYFSNNFTLANTWGHLRFFTFFYIVVPSIVFVLAVKISQAKVFSKWQKYVLPLLNLFTFFFLMELSVYTLIKKKLAVLLLLLAIILTLFLYKQLKKILIMQFVLAGIGLVALIQAVAYVPAFQEDWLDQPDAIGEAVFKKKPNIYFIQPDGYSNFSKLVKAPYNVDSSLFEDYLTKNSFKNYPNFRSNYASTLSSNSSVFMMKHHYYGTIGSGSGLSEALNARNVIISKNTVLDVFKNNGYKTHFISETPYLLLNRPTLGYDYTNYKLNDIAYINTGFNSHRDVFLDLKENIKNTDDTPMFFFVEFIRPGHIKNNKIDSRGAEGEREKWLELLEQSNEKLTELIDLIKEKDPNSLVVILADHGGYVGLNYAGEMYKKMTDEDLINSIFTAQLSIHWPNNEIFTGDKYLKSSVNVFRVLISYLTEENKYLEHLQDNSSYIILKEDAPEGVYRYINDSGEVVFKKHNLEP